MARGIRIPIGTDLSALDRGLAQVRGRFQALGTSLAATVGGAVAGAMSARMFGQLLSEFDALAKQARRLDVAAPTLQRLALAADLAGSSGEVLTRSLIALNARLRDSTAAGETYRQRLAAIGLEAQAFMNLGPERQLLELARAYERMNDPMQFQSELMGILGMRAQQIMPMISQGYDRLAQSLNDTNTLTAEQFQKIEEVRDSWARLVSEAKTGLLSEMVPAIELTTAMLREMNEVLGLVRQAGQVASFREIGARLLTMPVPGVSAANLMRLKEISDEALFRQAVTGRDSLSSGVVFDKLGGRRTPESGPISTLMAEMDEMAGEDAAGLRAREQALARVVQLEEQLFDMRKRVAEAGMTDRQVLDRREQEAQFLREIIGTQRDALAVAESEEDSLRIRQALLEEELRLQETLLDIERLRARVEQEKEERMGAGAQLGALSGAVSSLARVGGDRGAGLRGGPELDLARQRTRRLDEIAGTLTRIAEGPGLVLA